MAKMLHTLLVTVAVAVLSLAVPVSADSLVVTLSPAHASANTSQALAADYGLKQQALRRLSTLDRTIVTYRVPAAGRIAALIAGLKQDRRVEAVQTNFAHALAGMPVKDPYFDLQMRTERRGVAPLLQRGSGRGVRVAVIDTGADTEHPDLKGQISEAINFVSGYSSIVPGEFHGTGVAGLIVAEPGNGIGIHGLAPDAELIALRACWEPVYGYGLCRTDTLAQALDYAIDIRAHVINLSLAGPEDPMLSRLVQRALELGAIVFGAVGEDAAQQFPTNIPGVIAVQQAPINEGEASAPGLTVAGQQLLTTVPDARYDFVSGSSFATAHASGVAAVMLEQQPHLKSADVLEWLRRLHRNDPIIDK